MWLLLGDILLICFSTIFLFEIFILSVAGRAKITIFLLACTRLSCSL